MMGGGGVLVVVETGFCEEEKGVGRVEEGWVGLGLVRSGGKRGWVGTYGGIHTHTRGLRKATHRSGGVGYICIFDKVEYDMRTFFVTSQCCFGVSVRARSRTGFFRFPDPFLLCLARGGFFLRERAWGCFVCWEVVL